MPTYDYVCDACGHSFELFQSMTDSVKKTCPECGKKSCGVLSGLVGRLCSKDQVFIKPIIEVIHTRKQQQRTPKKSRMEHPVRGAKRKVLKQRSLIEGVVMACCPVCQSVVVGETAVSKPFCCERCRLVDLGRWLDETYAVPEVQKTGLEDAES